jgi:hypothetical protein
VSNDDLRAWRRRLRTARQLAEMLASGRQVWMRDGEMCATAADHGPGVVVYDLNRRTGLFAVRYRIVGYE